jgi:hypothetical protein
MQRDTEAANATYVTRELTYSWDEDGALVLLGRLPAEQGAMILKALEMQMERQFQEMRSADGSAETPAHSHSEADAHVSAETPEEPEARSPIAARRADALAEIAETYMNSRPVANSTGDRYQVIVHVSEKTTYIEDGPHVSAETSRRIGCDCNLIGVKDDENGEPLSIGRRSRLIPTSIRRALRLRDDGCRFPGCTRKHFVDAHHIDHWSEGGETSLDNLVLLCREHHRLVHEGGFGCERTGIGDIVFKDRRRKPLPHWSNPPPRKAESEAVRYLHERFDHLRIDADTCVPNWYAGDTCDWHMAVDGLLQCEADGLFPATADRKTVDMPRP